VPFELFQRCHVLEGQKVAWDQQSAMGHQDFLSSPQVLPT